jgi:threonine/homoserine/homoserine lactone efflux protein
MMIVTTFLIAFVFSFVGSIPPGVLNLTVIQLGLEHKLNIAYRFAFAAAIVEYPYAWIAVAFEELLTTSPAISESLQLMAAAVLIIVGAFNLWTSGQNSSKNLQLFKKGRGFRKGIVLSIVNPMALPFWLAVTAYVRGLGLIALDDTIEMQAYLMGVAFGAFAVLISFAHLARYATGFFNENSFVRRVPGLIMIALGVYGVARFFIEKSSAL